jgi:hypothetical protein
MTRESRKAAPNPREPDLFGPPAAPERYVPKPEHVRSGLRSLLERLASAETWWQWSDWDIERYREREVLYYCDLLPDREEAEEWRRQLAVEIARLDAASGPCRPADPRFIRQKA